jgi:hypothetical protein
LKWAQGSFAIAIGDGSSKVMEGHIAPPFGVHNIGRSSQSVYVVTHVPTGALVGSARTMDSWAFQYIAFAKRFADSLRDLLPWEQVATRNDTRLTPEVFDKVQELYRATRLEEREEVERKRKPRDAPKPARAKVSTRKRREGA